MLLRQRLFTPFYGNTLSPAVPTWLFPSSLSPALYHEQGDRHLMCQLWQGSGLWTPFPPLSYLGLRSTVPTCWSLEGGAVFRRCLTKVATWGHCDFAHRRLSRVWPAWAPGPLPDSSSSAEEPAGRALRVWHPGWCWCSGPGTGGGRDSQCLAQP